MPAHIRSFHKRINDQDFDAMGTLTIACAPPICYESSAHVKECMQDSLAGQEKALQVVLNGTVSEIIQGMAHFQATPAGHYFLQTKLRLM